MLRRDQNLDGETNLKIKRGAEGTGRCRLDEWRKMTEGGAYVECEHPNNSLYTFREHRRAALGGGRPDGKDSGAEGSATKRSRWFRQRVAPRFVSEEHGVGGWVGTYAGHDTKVMMNSSAALRSVRRSSWAWTLWF